MKMSALRGELSIYICEMIVDVFLKTFNRRSHIMALLFVFAVSKLNYVKSDVELEYRIKFWIIMKK